MKRDIPPTDDSWESDAIWKLLDQAPPASPSPRFATDTTRAARLLEQEPSLWKKWFFPASFGALATAAAAIVAITFVLHAPSQQEEIQQTASTETSQSESYAALQDAADTETLIVAADHLEEFSDTELVSLIGF